MVLFCLQLSARPTVHLVGLAHSIKGVCTPYAYKRLRGVRVFILPRYVYRKPQNGYNYGLQTGCL